VDLFPAFSTIQALVSYLDGVAFQVSPKITEDVVDFLSEVTRTSVSAATEHIFAIDYYVGHMESRLRILRDGDSEDFAPGIDAFQQSEGQLGEFVVTFTPRKLVQTLAQNVRTFLDLKGALLKKVQHLVPSSQPVITYRKQLELLGHFLDTRQAITGEREFSLDSKDILLRYAFWFLDDPTVVHRVAGTSGPEDKPLLILFLEGNGLLDIDRMFISSDPAVPDNVVIRYSVARPARRNVFEASAHGLTAPLRAQLSEIQLGVYDRLYKALNRGYIFGGKPQLEHSYAELAQWLIRKISFCLEEPSFVKEKAMTWLAANSVKERRAVEDGFFLPFLHERLVDAFGDRIVKKPKKFGGEIDILFDGIIPLELKVRRGAKKPLGAQDLDGSYRPGGQAAAYAALSRLAFVVVLDLPEGDEQLTNLDNCASVIEREFEEGEFNTCIAVFVFHCHHPRPSRSK
jgi:hypothetical protein